MAAKNQKIHSSSEVFVKLFFVSVVVVIPTLAWLILKPSEKDRGQNIEQTREFAKFIESNPEIISHTDHPTQLNLGNPVEHSADSQNTISNQNTTSGSLELNTSERASIYELDTQWKQVGFVRDQNWRNQIEYLFTIAERTKNPAILDILRQQIIEGKNDSQSENQSIARKNWYDRYYNLESRSEFKKEIEDSFDPTSPENSSDLNQ